MEFLTKLRILPFAFLTVATIGEAAEPVIITRQPQSVEVPESSFVRLSVEATGSIDGYTWLNDMNVVVGDPGPAARILELISVGRGRPIGYRVLITNGTTVVTSSIATVTVRAATAEPLWKGRLLTKVIGNGTEVPGFPGSYFANVAPSAPVIRQVPTLSYHDGTLYFTAPTPSVSRGVFRWQNGTLTTLVFTNTVTTTGNVSFVTADADGQVAFSATSFNPFSATLTSSSLNTWSEDGGPQVLLDRAVAAPGRAGNFRSFGSCARRGSGIAFLAFLELPGSPRPAGIYFHDGTTVSRIADDTTDLPGVSAGFAPITFRDTGTRGTYLNFDGNHIVFSSGGAYKATPQGIITKLVDSDDFVPGTTNRFASFEQIDVDGGLVFGISNHKAYAFDDHGGIRDIGLANVLSAAGPSMAYVYHFASGFNRWNDGTKEAVIPQQSRVFGEPFWQVLELDGQGDDVALVLSVMGIHDGIYVVSGPAPTNQSPVILVEPFDVNVTPLSQGMFAATASGPSPLHYQWRSDGVDISNATNDYLIVDSTMPAPVNGFSVVVTNEFGSVTSRVARLSRIEPTSLYLGFPQFHVTPSAYSSNVTITVRAGGSRPLSYQWRKGGADLPGETAMSLVITNITELSRGVYGVFVTDGFASRAASFTLDSIVPVITQQPQPVTGAAGSTISFEVAAIGVPPLTYQWWRNGVTVLAGATNAILVLTNVSILDAGDYTVSVVSEGKLGQRAYSSSASLTVLNHGPVQSPLLETPLYTPAGIFQFRLVTELGQAYEVQFTPSLVGQPSWSVVQIVRGNSEAILVSVPGGTAQGYYRAKVIR